MKEWIITNGIGGFASSTDLGGLNTRRYHGLLIAPLNPPRQRTLILSKVDESIEINGKKYNLYTNDVNKEISKGYEYLEKFEKEIIPIYTYDINGVIVEKSICMIYGKNAVVIVYKISNKKAKTKFNMTPLINFRDFHSSTTDKNFDYKQIINGDKCQIDFKNKYKVNIGVKGSVYTEHENDIFYNMHYQVEEDRGFDNVENHYIPGTFTVNLKPNEDKKITFICAMDGTNGLKLDEVTSIDGEKVIKDEFERIKSEIKKSGLKIKLSKGKNNTTKKENESNSDTDTTTAKTTDNELTLDFNNDNTIDNIDIEIYNGLVKKYIIASDNFIVYRKRRRLHTLIAGYPWFLDWGRDAYIAFEGLLLVPKRFDIAREVLLTFALKMKEGLLPNGFSEYDGKAMYNSVDAALLFIDAVNKYVKYTDDYEFVKKKLYKTMKEIIDKYIDGIELDKNNIYLDDKDYLLVSGSPDIQNTWMDAKVNGIAITPRNGKAVEINALWYNALRIMQDLNAHWKKPLSNIEYSFLAKKCKNSFENKFYNEEKKCLYDVIEVEKNEFRTVDIGADNKIRPNQIFALSLSYPVLDLTSEKAKNTFVTVSEKLLNKYGLKTLAEGEEGYCPVYQGNPTERDRIYHQGITWPWLLGPYYDALKNLIKSESEDFIKDELNKTLTKFRINTAFTFWDEINNGNTIGSISEVYDSVDKPKGKGAFAQAWSVSEIFRIIFGV